MSAVLVSEHLEAVVSGIMRKEAAGEGLLSQQILRDQELDSLRS